MASSSKKVSNSNDIPCSSMNIPFDDSEEEPSPLDKILIEGRSYNGGKWTSDELNRLFDGVHKYGTKPKAIEYVKGTLITRTSEEIKAKIDEIREIMKEHKELTLPQFYHNKWIENGFRNNGPPPSCRTNPDEDWSNILSEIVNHHHGSINKTKNPMRDTLEKVFTNMSNESVIHDDVKVTKLQTAKATPNDTQQIRWPLIYQFMKQCAEFNEHLPALNELEAAVILKVLDKIEDEAAAIPESEKAILAGLFTACQLDDFRLVEQDYPPTDMSGTQLLVDPLRTRTHQIPPAGAEVELLNNDGGTLPSTST